MMRLEGKSVTCALRFELISRSAALAESWRPPRLAAVLVGNDEASELYLKRKVKLGKELGVDVEEHRLPETSEAELASLLYYLSLRSDVDGILLEQPLPAHIQKARVIRAISPAKDVDGSTGGAASLLTGDAQGLIPATPLAVMRLLRHYQVPLAGAEVVIVGHSPVVGKPLALLMLHENATVTVCHKDTRDLAFHTRRADLLVVAAGVPGLIRGDMLRPGAVVVDVGINVVNGKTVGDVEFESAATMASAIAPVPGGVGPLTTLTILENTIFSAERRMQEQGVRRAAPALEAAD